MSSGPPTATAPPTATGATTATTAAPIAQATSSSWLVRRLRQTKSVAECLELVPEDPSQDVVVAALHICGKHNDLGTAIELMKRHPSDTSLSLTISIAGKLGDYKKALQLLYSCSAPSSPSIASYHACLAACGKAKAWRDCLDLYERLDPANRTACTAGIVLTAMAKSNRGSEALDFFHSLPESRRDVQAVLKTMTALIGMRDLEAARQLVENNAPHEAMIVNRLTSAYAKAGNWEMVRHLNAQSSQQQTTQPPKQKQQQQQHVAYSFEPWNGLPKLGKGRAAYWKLGTYRDKDTRNLTVALHPHRNPTKNGIKLLLLDDTDVKIGFLLMQNTPTESSLLGVFLDPNQRQRGLCKLVLALWMTLCLDAKITPLTGVMNKPLLCLSLQHTFGYTPAPNNQGVSVEISSSGTADGTIVMYSPSKKAIGGAFSPADKEREGLVFVTEPPDPRGRIVHIKTCLVPPTNLHTNVQKVLASGTFEYDRQVHLKTILCGSS